MRVEPVFRVPKERGRVSSTRLKAVLQTGYAPHTVSPDVPPGESPPNIRREPRRKEAVQGSERYPSPRTTPGSQEPSAPPQVWGLPWAERQRDRPPADASGKILASITLRPDNPLPPMAGLFLFPAMNRLRKPHAQARGPRHAKRGSSPNVTPLP
jgi:hypothetical protein